MLTLTGNTDGVRIFKSKRKSSFWPVQMFINENPINKRFKRSNIILTNIWFGKDPDFNLYLKPFTDELQDLAKNNIKLTIDGTTYEIAIRLFLMTADTPARCKFLCMKQFNGKFGCTYCTHPGVILEGSNQSKYDTTQYSLRTHADTIKLMKQFADHNIEELGIIGVSPLVAVPDYDLHRRTVIDYMHSVLLGNSNAMLDLWIDSKNHAYDYYITPRQKVIVERRISFIAPLTNFTRKPRSIEDRQFWKANEHKYWLLFYAVPCLRGILPDKYLLHFSLLSEAIFILTKTNISASDFEKASANLRKFIIQYQEYYGIENMVYNVHLLSHLADCVKNCGPLWAYSNFNFEDNNGELASYVQGTTDVEKQILSKIFYDGIILDFSSRSLVLSKYLDHINNTNVKISEKCGTITLFGKPLVHKCFEHEKVIVNEDTLGVYKKFFYEGDIFYSASKKSKQTNDAIVKLRDGSFGEIQLIFWSNLY